MTTPECKHPLWATALLCVAAWVALAIVVLTLCSILTGCAVYRHERLAADGVRETTSARALLMKGALENLTSDTEDGEKGYRRRVGVKSMIGETETEKLGVLIESAVRGAVKGAKP